MATIKIKKPAKVTTEWIKQQLSTVVFPNSGTLHWKRISKRKIGDNIERKFCYPGKPTVRVLELDREVTFEPLTDLPQLQMEDALKHAAKAIKHCGDYGNLYYNHTTKEVWWEAGDGDSGEPLTSIEEIKNFLSLPGITRVYVEAECGPDDADTDWKYLGRHGVEYHEDLV